MDLDYYDKILIGIFLSLIAGASTGLMTVLPVQYGVSAGAGLALVLMYHGMFRNGPLG